MMTTLESRAALSIETAGLPVRAAVSPARAALRQFLRSPSGVCGVGLLILLVLMTATGPSIYPVDPLDLVGAPFMPPSADAWLGTDYLGRDVLAGLIYGGRATLAVGGIAALITIAIGLTVGALS